MGASYSSTFPAAPPADPDDPASVAQHDQAAFEHIEQMLCHWDRPHRPSYHWMINLDEEPRAIDLSERCQKILPREGLNLVPPESLHLTVRRFGYIDEVSPTTLDAAAASIRDHCLRLSAFRLRLLPLAGSPGALRLSVAPWSPLLGLYRAVSQASGYNDFDPLKLYRPHVGVAYSSFVQTPHPFIDAARNAQLLPSAEIVVRSLRLVHLYRTDYQYQWRLLAHFPFGRT